jgi:hypothetical protein
MEPTETIQPQGNLPGSSSPEELMDLLKRQNALLESLNSNLTYSMEKENERVNLRVRVMDIDMSIGAMIAFLFKWAIASIPFAIILFIISFFIGIAFSS